MKRGRWLFAATIILAATLSAFWIFGAWIGWSACCWLVRMDFAIALAIGAVLNVLGVVAFVIRSRGWGTPTLGAVQIGSILFALAASVAVSPAWLVFDGAPALVILLLLFQRSKGGSPEGSAPSAIR